MAQASPGPLLGLPVVVHDHTHRSQRMDNFIWAELVRFPLTLPLTHKPKDRKKETIPSTTLAETQKLISSAFIQQPKSSPHIRLHQHDPDSQRDPPLRPTAPPAIGLPGPPSHQDGTLVVFVRYERCGRCG